MVKDFKLSQAIYGPLLPAIKGRTRYKESERVQDLDIVRIPSEIYEDLKNVVLCADFQFVNVIRVKKKHTIPQRLDYQTVSFPINKSKETITSEIKKVYQQYQARGFCIFDVHADMEFEAVEQFISPIHLQVCGKDDHVPKIE